MIKEPPLDYLEKELRKSSEKRLQKRNYEKNQIDTLFAKRWRELTKK